MAFGGVFVPPFRPVFDPIGVVAAPPAGDWWTAGGAPTPIAVYQPKGAASLAASYVNLVNPGTYDATPIVAPTLGSSGWDCNGTQRLDSGVLVNPASTILVRFSNATLSSTRYLFGGMDGGGTRGAAALTVAGGYASRFVYGADSAWRYPPVSAGVFALAGGQPYADGAPYGTEWSAWSGDAATIGIGAGHIGGTYQYPMLGTIVAMAIWDTSTDAATWMPEIMAAVALI